MPLPNVDPSNPDEVADPIFADVDAGRGDHLRFNNQKVWGNLSYLDEAVNSEASTRASADTTLQNNIDSEASTRASADTTLQNNIDGKVGLSGNETISGIKTFSSSPSVPAPSSSNDASSKGYVDARFPVGTYIQYSMGSAPAGFLACDGSAVSRATYADLFALLGVTYGVGNGTTTFNLPDARGLVMVGAGAHGTMQRANGAAYNGGSVGASRNDQMQGHYHNLKADDSNTGTINNGYPGPGGPANDGGSSNIAVQAAVTDGINGTPRTGDETRPAEIAVLVCIKY